VLEDIIVADEKSGWKMRREESWGGREERKESRRKVQREIQVNILWGFSSHNSLRPLFSH
jgi:hypothetical protein